MMTMVRSPDQMKPRWSDWTRNRATNAARMPKSPCARLTIRMTPNTRERPVANRAYRPPRRMPCRPTLTQSILSHPEVGCSDRFRTEVAWLALEADAAFEEAGDVVGDGEDVLHVLFDDQDRGARADEEYHGLVDALDDHGRETERDFVEQQDLRVGHQGAPVVIKRIYEAMVLLVGTGTTILVVEQDVQHVLTVADYVACFLEGRISLEGKPSDLSSEAITAAYFGM